jgi:hypothetical protein
MGRRVLVAAIVAALIVGGPVVVPEAGMADAQANTCYCYASVDAIDSDLQFVDRYFNSVAIELPADACESTCDAWRQEWFYQEACDFPVRINRGRNAWWGYYDGRWETYNGPYTWFCPFPPP